MKTAQEAYDLYMCPVPSTNQICYYHFEGDATQTTTATLDVVGEPLFTRQ